MGDLLDRWFNNNKNNASIRHEFPLYNVTDGLHSVEDSIPPLVMEQNKIKKADEKPDGKSGQHLE